MKLAVNNEIKLSASELAKHVLSELSSNDGIRYRLASSNYNEYRLSACDFDDLTQNVTINVLKAYPNGYTGSAKHLNNLIYKKYNETLIDMLRSSKAITRGFDLEFLVPKAGDGSISRLDHYVVSNAVDGFCVNSTENELTGKTLKRHLRLVENDVEAPGLADLITASIESGNPPKVSGSLKQQGLATKALTVLAYDEELKDLLVEISNNSSVGASYICDSARLLARKNKKVKSEKKDETNKNTIQPLFSMKTKNGVKVSTIQVGVGDEVRIFEIQSSGDFESDKKHLLEMYKKSA